MGKTACSWARARLASQEEKQGHQARWAGEGGAVPETIAPLFVIHDSQVRRCLLNPLGQNSEAEQRPHPVVSSGAEVCVILTAASP